MNLISKYKQCFIYLFCPKKTKFYNFFFYYKIFRDDYLFLYRGSAHIVEDRLCYYIAVENMFSLCITYLTLIFRHCSSNHGFYVSFMLDITEETNKHSIYKCSVQAKSGIRKRFYHCFEKSYNKVLR